MSFILKVCGINGLFLEFVYFSIELLSSFGSYIHDKTQWKWSLMILDKLF